MQFLDFNLNNLSSTAYILIIGRNDYTEAKHNLITTILKKFHHTYPEANSLIVSKDIHFYKNNFPKAQIEKKYSQNLLKLSKDTNINGAIILDDCLDTVGSYQKDEPFIELMYNGKHYKNLVILSMQYPLGLKPEFRCQFDYVFLFGSYSLTYKKKLYNYYAGFFPNLNLFNESFNDLTSNNDAMVIKNRGFGKNICDRIFHYKFNKEINNDNDNDIASDDSGRIVIYI